MLVTFILGLAAGWAAPHVEAQVKAILTGPLALGEFSAADLRAAALAACILVAAIVALFTGGGHPLPLAIGVALGVLAPRLWQKVRAASTPDYDS